MELVSTRRPAHRPASRPPVLFVPGAFTGAWIWRDTFMPAFHEAGYDVHAMSFRGHGKRGWALNRHGLDSYVKDLEAAIDMLGIPPIVVAHSLGGLVTLRLLESMTLPGALLLSPIPPDGVARSLLSLGFKSPLSVAKLLSVTIDPRVTGLGSPPVGIYSDRAESAVAEGITRRLQAESIRALGEALLPRGVDKGRISTPLRLYGAEGDHVIPAAEVRRAAAYLAAPARIYRGMSHTFQAEPDWDRVANDMLRDLGEMLGSGTGLAADQPGGAGPRTSEGCLS